MIAYKSCSLATIILFISSSSPMLAQTKSLLACEVMKTGGLRKTGSNWRAAEFAPRSNYLRNKDRFVIALDTDNKITEESAQEIFGSNSAICRVRNDVGMTFCNSPIGNHLILSLSQKIGSTSDISSVDEKDSAELTVSVFQCQKF